MEGHKLGSKLNKALNIHVLGNLRSVIAINSLLGQSLV